MKQILISGGAGFLGSNLVKALLPNYQVVVIDNFSTGRRNNLKDLVDQPNFLQLIEADICQPLPSEIQKYKFDYIMNLASPASPPGYQRLALETLRVGSIGTENLLELAREQQARFFHASTSEVYGDPEIHPQPESYWGNVNSYGPRSMYDESKRYAEALIYSYRQKYGLDTAIVRIFNTYGPQMDPADGRVVSNFIVQALRQQPITVYGQGEQTRSFCYVDDLIRGFILLLESQQAGPINLGNPGEFTVAELAAKVIKLTNSQSVIEYSPLPKDDPMQRQPDISLAKELLGWQPDIDLESGLQKTIEYFKHEIAAEN